MKKVLLCLFVFAMVLPLLCACGGERGDETETQQKTVVDPLEETLGFGPVVNDEWPEFKIMVNNSNNAFDMKNDFIGSSDGDKVSQKTLQRTEICEEYLSIDIEYTQRAGNYNSKLPSAIRDLIMAGNFDFGMVSMALNVGITSQIISIYKNVMEMDYIDLSHMWWIDALSSQASMNGQLYFLAGDACISTYGYLGCCYANLDVAQTLNIFDETNPTFFYDLVKDGGWTLEKFLQLAEAGQDGLSGTGELAWINAETGVRNMYTSCGLEIITQKTDGSFAVKQALDDKDLHFIEVVYNTDRDGVSDYFNAGGLSGTAVPMFAQNKALFLTHYVYEAVNFRAENMESTYAVLPMPKYDANQTDYISTAMPAFDVLWFPSTLEGEMEKTAAKVGEYMGYYGMEYIVPEYYDNTLKYKVNNEKTNAILDANVDMLDFIREKLRISPNETFGLIPGANDQAGTSMIAIFALSDLNISGTYPLYTQPVSTWKSFAEIGATKLNNYVMQYYGMGVQ